MYFPSRPDGPAAQCCHSCQRQLLARNPRMRPTTQLPTYWLTRFGWKYLGTSPTSLMGKLPLGIERAHLHPPLQPAASGGIPHCPPNHTAWRSVTPCKTPMHGMQNMHLATCLQATNLWPFVRSHISCRGRIHIPCLYPPLLAFHIYRMAHGRIPVRD